MKPIDLFRAGFWGSGDAASIIAGLFAQGQQGFWFPFTDFASLSQDSAGTLPYTALQQPVGRVLDRSGRGNHASQVTSTARGAVGARGNNIPGFASVGNGWISQAQGSGSTGVIAANTLDTDGGYITSIQLRLNGGSTISDISQVRVYGTTTGLSYVCKFQIRTTDGSSKVVGYGDSYTNINMISITGEWADVTIGPNQALSTAALLLYLRGALGHSDSANIDVRRVSSVLASQASLPYQRVNTPTDYDDVGFPKYLRLDGTNDFYTCGGGGSTTGFYYSDVIRPMQFGPSYKTLFYNGNPVTRKGYFVSLTTSGQLEFAAGNGTINTAIASPVLTLGEAAHICCWDDMVNMYLQVNGGTIYSVPRPAVVSGGATINLFSTGTTQNFNGNITEPIYRAGPPPSAYERGVIRNYQMQKAGLL